MLRQFGYSLLALSLVVTHVSGCGELTELDSIESHDKRRSLPLPPDTWSSIQSQDLAILLPRIQGDEISADTPTADGNVLLSKTWMTQVGDAYLSTDVEGAFTEENWYEEWQVVSMRIAPCSPLGKTPGPEAQILCWPEVRIVWQPVIYDFFLSWKSITVDAFSDDRAIHALYRVYPEGSEKETDTMIRTIQERMEKGLGVDREELSQFTALRTVAIEELLGDVIGLRDPTYKSSQYAELDIRAETFGSDDERESFYTRLRTFLGDYAQPSALHALTSFSLPEGQEPALIDIWVFLAFDGHQGELTQKSIEVTDPKTGDTIFDYGLAETVASAQPDHRVLDRLEDRSADTRAIREQILGPNPLERFKLADRINDPDRTLVPNTSCATCHSFNEESFDFHNLSYLQEVDMTIAPRVKNDVRHDLNWLRTP